MSSLERSWAYSCRTMHSKCMQHQGLWAAIVGAMYQLEDFLHRAINVVWTHGPIS